VNEWLKSCFLRIKRSCNLSNPRTSISLPPLSLLPPPNHTSATSHTVTRPVPPSPSPMSQPRAPALTTAFSLSSRPTPFASGLHGRVAQTLLLPSPSQIYTGELHRPVEPRWGRHMAVRGWGCCPVTASKPRTRRPEATPVYACGDGRCWWLESSRSAMTAQDLQGKSRICKGKGREGWQKNQGAEDFCDPLLNTDPPGSTSCLNVWLDWDISFIDLICEVIEKSNSVLRFLFLNVPSC
jgi:hypothetical protein